MCLCSWPEVSAHAMQAGKQQVGVSKGLACHVHVLIHGTQAPCLGSESELRQRVDHNVCTLS